MNGVANLLHNALNPQLLAGWFLLSLRLGATFMMTPVFYHASVPLSARMLIVMTLATVMSWSWVDSLPLVSLASTNIWLAALAEAALGCMLGLGIIFAFSAVSFAGRLLDIQIGFSIAQVINPATQQQASVLTALLDLVAITVFFSMSAHHTLLRGMHYSLEVFPLGAPWSPRLGIDIVIQQFALLFAHGFAMAAPVALAVVTTESALGVMSRFLPQVNMLIMGAPVKVVVGLLAFWVSALGIHTLMVNGFIDIGSYWAILLETKTNGVR